VSTDAEIIRAFPRLAYTPWRRIPWTYPRRIDRVNCIAWALGDCTRRWWPNEQPKSYWPVAAHVYPTRLAFEAVFRSEWYLPCGDSLPTPGFDKIALFIGNNGFVSHAAKQTVAGQWTSKLGIHDLIEHELAGLEYGDYGTAVAYYWRSVEAG
jgi:hypothetical protein